jgi:hypothetical protein
MMAQKLVLPKPSVATAGLAARYRKSPVPLAGLKGIHWWEIKGGMGVNGASLLYGGIE